MKFKAKKASPLTKILSIMVLSTWLIACAGKPALESQAVINLNNNLAMLSKWQFTGKIAWITQNERKSAYIHWRQNDNTMHFSLNNMLGINLAKLSFDGNMATLNADDKEYTDPSPSALVYQTTGWRVPLEPLSSWVKGAASVKGRLKTNDDINSRAPKNQKTSDKSAYSKSSNMTDASIIRYENGLIKQIKPTCTNCDSWTIDYTSYENVILNDIQYQLPKQINMFNSAYQATIKIRISDWSE
jgi:outer membrane lipoprotein LolB